MNQPGFDDVLLSGRAALRGSQSARLPRLAGVPKVKAGVDDWADWLAGRRCGQALGA